MLSATRVTELPLLSNASRRRFRLANRAFVRIASVGRLADEGGADGGAEAAKYCACYAAPNALSKLPMFSERSFLSSSTQTLYRASVLRISFSRAPVWVGYVTVQSKEFFQNYVSFPEAA